MPERFRAHVAAYLVLAKNDKILLLRRYNTGYQDGKYSLVAGHLEGNETAAQSIIRETYEEAGIKLNLENLKVAHVMHRRSADREYFDIYLWANEWSGEIKNMEPNKCHELKLFPMNELPNNILPEVKQALEHIDKNVHYSEFGW